MIKTKYPLKQLIRIKQRRLDAAQRLLQEKKEELQKEQKKYKELEEDRDVTLQHRTNKLQQLREELDKGCTTDKIEIMRSYLKVVEEELKQKEKRVEDQKKEVEEAEKRVEEARKDMIKKQYDIEKINTHYEEWKKEEKALIEYEEGIENDELGTAMHNLKKYKKK